MTKHSIDMELDRMPTPKNVSFSWREYTDILIRIDDLQEQVKELEHENQMLREQLDGSGVGNTNVY